MIRSGFQRKNAQPQPSHERVTKWPVALAKPTRSAIKTIAYACISQPKDQPVRHEGYRRLVAAMPCKACGIQGYSQAAHLPPEGKGIKQDDRMTFPLCCARVGVTGCHFDYDQYRMFSHEVAVTVGRAWAADTQRQIVAAGKWPKNLPLPDLREFDD